MSVPKIELPPAMWHCNNYGCGVEWDQRKESGCWMCGGTGKPGRTPVRDGRAPQVWHGFSWKPGRPETPWDAQYDKPVVKPAETQEAA